MDTPTPTAGDAVQPTRVGNTKEKKKRRKEKKKPNQSNNAAPPPKHTSQSLSCRDTSISLAVAGISNLASQAASAGTQDQRLAFPLAPSLRPTRQEEVLESIVPTSPGRRRGTGISARSRSPPSSPLSRSTVIRPTTTHNPSITPFFSDIRLPKARSWGGFLSNEVLGLVVWARSVPLSPAPPLHCFFSLSISSDHT